jgi:hypothetical protein
MSIIAFLLVASLTSAKSSPDSQRPIDVPYQAIPAYMAYTQCVADHLGESGRARGADPSEVRQANSAALAACHDVRAEQLARALAAQTDNRVYGSADGARAAVRRACDRFDSDYQVETVETPAATHGKEQ